MSVPDYLVIGHITRDVVGGGTFRQGGTATFAALTARALGCRVAVLTSAGDDQRLDQVLEGIAVRLVPAARSTVFENIYHGGSRVQFVRSTAAPLTAAHLPLDWRQARIVHLGPVAQEVAPELVDLFPVATLVGVTPQGWLRQWDAAGRVGFRPWVDAERILKRADAMVLSREDAGSDDAEWARYLRLARLTVVTQGWRGATLQQAGHSEVFPAYDVPEIDPTGAGDVFAAAFFIRLAETGEPGEAVRFANAAASFVVEGEGYSTIADRATVEERLRNGVLRQA